MQMLPANVMIHAIDSALENRKVTFDRIGRDANTLIVTNVLIGPVVN